VNVFLHKLPLAGNCNLATSNTLSMILANFKKQIPGYLAFIIIAAGLSFLTDYYSKKNCHIFYKDLSFSGVVTKKYVDYKQHEYPFIELRTSVDSTQLISLSNDNSGLFELIQVNDSLTKSSGELKVHVYRCSSDSTIFLQIKCI